MELNLNYIKVGHKRTVIPRDGTFLCKNEKVIAQNG